MILPGLLNSFKIISAGNLMLEVSVMVILELNNGLNERKISRLAFGGVAITIKEFSCSGN